MESGEIVMRLLLLETFGARTGGARKSKVYKKVTDRAQVSNELGAEEQQQLQLYYRSDPRGGVFR